MSKPTKHHGRADKPRPSEYRVKTHSAAAAKKTGWQGTLVPVKPVNAAKILREISSRARRERPTLPL